MLLHLYPKKSERFRKVNYLTQWELEQPQLQVGQGTMFW